MYNIVDDIFVINLDDNKSRLHEFDIMMKRLQLKYNRFSAIQGDKLPDNNFYRNKYLKKFNFLSKGEIGCLLSHVMLWEELVNNDNLNRILIFEDDARTHTNNISQLITDFYNYINDNNIGEPDILYLGKSLDYCSQYEAVYSNLVYKSVHPQCLHAYIITKEGARKLLSLAPYSKAIDLIPINAINMNLIDVMVFHPSLYFQDIFGLKSGEKVTSTNSNLRKIQSALNSTTECIVPHQHITNETWEYTTVIFIGLIISFILFCLFMFF